VGVLLHGGPPLILAIVSEGMANARIDGSIGVGSIAPDGSFCQLDTHQHQAARPTNCSIPTNIKQ
jgi:hypothetical protein